MTTVADPTGVARLGHLVNRRVADDDTLTADEILVADALITALQPVLASVSELTRLLQPWLGET